MPTRLDSMLSHGMGKVKAVKARLTGLVGVFRTLAEQHGEVTMLLERAKASDEKFAALWPMIKRQLISHERAEVRELFPVIRAYPQTKDFADQHDHEAGQLERMIEQIDELGMGTPERAQLYQQLIDLVVRHADEEETTIFPKAQEAMGKSRAEALLHAFLATQEQIASQV